MFDSDLLEILLNLHRFGASLVVQRLRVCLAMQGTPVLSLVQEDPTCRGNKVCVPQLLSPRSGVLCSGARHATAVGA